MHYIVPGLHKKATPDARVERRGDSAGSQSCLRAYLIAFVFLI